MSTSGDNQPTTKSIAFSFSKKVKQNSITFNNKLIEDLKTNDGNEVDFVTSIDDNQIQSTVKKEEKKELVIPLIMNNRYVLKKDSNKPSKNESNDNQNNINDKQTEPKKEESLEEMAKRELLKEANQWSNDEQNNKSESSRVIPVIDSLLKNKVPEGYEANDNFDVSLRPIEPTTVDYETVPVEEFGLALLRGMGWKPGMAVGANTKEMYVPNEPQIRPKGLGLGAESSLKTQIKKISKDLKEEDLQPKKGSFVCIEFGAHKGSYGVIEDFDDDMSRITVRLTLKKEAIRLPVALIRVVSKQEFHSEGKVINKSQFEEYKQKVEKSENHKKEPQIKSEKSHKNSDHTSSHHKRSDSSDKYRKRSSHKTWLLPNLRVRIIDSKYKNGKYFKEKVVISEVLSSDKCCCKTSDDRLLEDIDIKMLETVIPRQNDTNVMILEGKHRKQLANILSKNRDRNEAEVQLLSDGQKILTLSLDQISEYVQ